MALRGAERQRGVLPWRQASSEIGAGLSIAAGVWRAPSFGGPSAGGCCYSVSSLGFKLYSGGLGYYLARFLAGWSLDSGLVSEDP